MENQDSRIVSYLVENGWIQKEDLEKVLPPDQPLGDLSIEEHLINAGLINGEQFRKAIE